MAYTGSVATRKQLATSLGLNTTVRNGGSSSCSSNSTGKGKGKGNTKRMDEGGSSRAHGRAARVPASDGGETGATGESGAVTESFNVIVTSYSVLRSDAEVLGGQVRVMQCAVVKLVAMRMERLVVWQIHGVYRNTLYRNCGVGVIYEV